MANPTQRDITRAYDALDKLSKAALEATASVDEICMLLSWHKDIFGALPPKPEPTMEDIGWDEDEHYLAEAVTKKGTKLIMLELDDDVILTVHPDTTEFINFDLYELTPTGRKFEFKEKRDV